MNGFTPNLLVSLWPPGRKTLWIRKLNHECRNLWDSMWRVPISREWDLHPNPMLFLSGAYMWIRSCTGREVDPQVKGSTGISLCASGHEILCFLQDLLSASKVAINVVYFPANEKEILRRIGMEQTELHRTLAEMAIRIGEDLAQDTPLPTRIVEYVSRFQVWTFEFDIIIIALISHSRQLINSGKRSNYSRDLVPEIIRQIWRLCRWTYGDLRGYVSNHILSSEGQGNILLNNAILRLMYPRVECPAALEVALSRPSRMSWYEAEIILELHRQQTSPVHQPRSLARVLWETYRSWRGVVPDMKRDWLIEKLETWTKQTE